MLAAAIFARPDLLLLDEPTNHLSILAVLWLTRELSTNPVWEERIVVTGVCVCVCVCVCAHARACVLCCVVLCCVCHLHQIVRLLCPSPSRVALVIHDSVFVAVALTLSRDCDVKLCLCAVNGQSVQE